MHSVSTEEAKSEGYCEGVVFVHPDFKSPHETVTLEKDGEKYEACATLCKLRRDMFDWYDGHRH